MSTWRFIDSGPCDAAYNMALDEAIAESVGNGDAPPTFRVYGWQSPAVSLGAFQKITDIDERCCAACNIPIVRRPTGGRGILHGDELTYSFSSKNEGPFSRGLLDTYYALSRAFAAALAEIGICVEVKRRRESGRVLTRSPLCFQSASYGEISHGGKKLIGSAQKRWADGFLQQGSIPYTIDYGRLASVFHSKSGGSRDHGDKGFASLAPAMVGLKEVLRYFDPETFKQCLRQSFETTFAVTLADALPSHREQELARTLLTEKYRNPRWTEAAVKCRRSCENSETQRQA